MPFLRLRFRLFLISIRYQCHQKWFNNLDGVVNFGPLSFVIKYFCNDIDSQHLDFSSLELAAFATLNVRYGNNIMFQQKPGMYSKSLQTAGSEAEAQLVEQSTNTLEGSSQPPMAQSDSGAKSRIISYYKVKKTTGTSITTILL
jgi:hypothetical protein